MAVVDVSGMQLHVSEKTAAHWPRYSYELWPDNFCGAGRGLAEKLVPDYVFALAKVLPSWARIINPIKIAPACAGHDFGWEFADPTWDAFHEENHRLRTNIAVIIVAQTTPGYVRNYALRYSEVYYDVVELVGRKIFWRLKQSQCCVIPESAEQELW